MNDKEIQRIRECELGLRIMRLQAEVAELREEPISLSEFDEVRFYLLQQENVELRELLSSWMNMCSHPSNHMLQTETKKALGDE